jgi:very-short-patch-repair endonuclease
MPRIINNFQRKDIRKELRKNQTPQEIILWSKLRNNQTEYKWKRQVSIGPYVTDFYCWKKLLVIEIDGSQHLDNQEYDKEREKYFLDLGIKTIRFWNNEINTNIDEVLKIIMEKLEMQPHLSPLLKGEEVKSSNYQRIIGRNGHRSY